MKRATTIIIGAGQAGLAMSRELTDRGVDHVLLERGAVAQSWRSERWDSLRLLTPNWQSRLPGHVYEGADPDGYMTMPEVTRFLQGYAQKIDAPVRCRTTVTSVRPADGGYTVATDRGPWSARNVVLASGACNIATVPKLGESRPWDLSFLFRRDTQTSHRLATALKAAAPELTIGYNEPYTVDDASDWFVPQHGEKRRLAHSLIEIRNDHLTDEAGCRRWAELLGACIETVLPEL